MSDDPSRRSAPIAQPALDGLGYPRNADEDCEDCDGDEDDFVFHDGVPLIRFLPI